MRNITVSVDDETYRRARIRAAELDTSVSRLVREYLNELASHESEFEASLSKEKALRASIERFSGSDRLNREELHDRRT